MSPEPADLARPPTPGQDDLDLTDPGFFAAGDPDRIYRRLRREDPVHWTKGRLSFGFWSVARHADVKAVYLLDEKSFSMQRNGPVLPPGAEFEMTENSLVFRLFREGAMLGSMDGPEHTALRRAFSKRFSLPDISRFEGLVAEIAGQILDEVLPRGECDFATDIAARLPMAVICRLMDIPRADWDDLYRWNNMVASPDDPEFSVGSALQTSQEGGRNLVGYCLDLARRRRAAPGDDMLSMIATAEIDGKALSDQQLGYNGKMLLAAGHETTRNTLCASFLELMGNDAELAWLRARSGDAASMKIAVEEFVRWATPLTHQMRTATEDTEIGGQKIAEGERVVCWNLSANRDEAVFAEPYRLDPARSPNPHLGFGHGKHFCLGVHLARLEMRVLIPLLLDHMQDLRLAAPPEPAAGIKHMRVAFTPARRHK
jgi:cytochrome P450